MPLELPSVLRLALATLAATAAFAVGAATPGTVGQREAFREAWAAAERGERDGLDRHAALLSDYVLRPDLEAAWLHASIGERSASEIERFLAEHAGHPAAVPLGWAWLDELGRRRAWAPYLEQYSALGGSDRAGRRCTSLEARAALAGADGGWLAEAEQLWLVGHSQPGACDAVFERLESAGRLTEALRRERLGLAIEARELGLARYLARSLGPADRERVARWSRAAADPAAAIGAGPATGDADAEERLVFAFRHLARRDPDAARDAWEAISPRVSWSGDNRNLTARRIALNAAYHHRPWAAEALAALPQSAVDEEVASWRVRAALRSLDWPAVLGALGALDASTRETPAWRYWRARALEATGAARLAGLEYAVLAGERGFFGFLAAERAGREPAIDHRPAAADAAAVAALADRPAFVRALELFAVGLESRGRLAWLTAIAGERDEVLVAAARLAHERGWHSQAIATLARAEVWDDLDVRYPLAYQPALRAAVEDSGVREAWALGVMRSESLFMSDVASPAGALGLMQLMPRTGRELARELGQPFPGSRALLEPDLNLRLGVRYLEHMLERFGGHVATATAAYNAGPARVDRWLPETSPLPADVWIETIPFDETRGYVRRVLEAKAIFEWRLSGEAFALSAVLEPVAAPARVAAVPDCGDKAC